MNFRQFNMVPLPVLLLNEDGTILFANQLLAYLLRQVAGKEMDIIGMSLYDRLPAEYLPLATSSLLGARKTRETIVSQEIEVSAVSGEKYRLFLRVSWSDEYNCFCCLFDDNTSLTHKIFALTKEATEDPLTGLYNRRAFYDKTKSFFASGVAYGILSLDIDHFKRINDTYGHDAGDEILKAVAHRCRAMLRGQDIFARFGGEEFVVFLPLADKNVLETVGERIRKDIEGHITVLKSGEQVHCTLSIGGALHDEKEASESLDMVIKRADENLYAAKEGGRNRCIVS